MKIVLINPPHTAIGSRQAGEHLPPLGLLSIGGPLIDAGYWVRLIDADHQPLPLPEIARQARLLSPEVIMIGHSGSSSVHATVLALCDALRLEMPEVRIVYGGVHPTYHCEETLLLQPKIDVIVRGEGERTCLRVVHAFLGYQLLSEVPGIAFRQGGRVCYTADADPIENLDDYRVGWELIDHRQYSYWGGKRAVVVQFSRGCLHRCSYCGQHMFWGKWRHRDPVLFARELARLHREHGVELINFADELPTGSRTAWRKFLEALIQEEVPLLLVGSTRASDIVRDADLLPLYKKAGVIRFLLGIESYDDQVLQRVRKDSCADHDQKAIRLLQQNGIVAMATCVVGFKEESDLDYVQTLRQLLRYDPDQVQLIYATPHQWTDFYKEVEERRVVQEDTRLWDYKHQVLSSGKVPPWRVFFWFKLIEAFLQLRPRTLMRYLFHPDGEYRSAMRWYTHVGKRVWLHEVWEFLFQTRHIKKQPTLKEFRQRLSGIAYNRQATAPTEKLRIQ